MNTVDFRHIIVWYIHSARGRVNSYSNFYAPIIAKRGHDRVGCIQERIRIPFALG